MQRPRAQLEELLFAQQRLEIQLEIYHRWRMVPANQQCRYIYHIFAPPVSSVDVLDMYSLNLLSSVLQYGSKPISWFQKKIRGNTDLLSDHISKEMNELNLIRCKRIPKRPGCDWHDLPNEKVPFRHFIHLMPFLFCCFEPSCNHVM